MADKETPEAPAAGELLREVSTGVLIEALESQDQGVARFLMQVLGAGLSENGYNYSVPVVKEAAPLLEGRPAYIDHDELGASTSTAVAGPRSFRSKLGWWSDVVYDEAREAIVGVVNLYKSGPEAWVAERISEALAADRPDDSGVSVLAFAHTVMKPGGDGKVYKEVVKINKFRSADLVAEAAADGKALKIAASVGKDEEIVKVEEATTLAELHEAKPEMTLAEAIELKGFSLKADVPLSEALTLSPEMTLAEAYALKPTYFDMFVVGTIEKDEDYDDDEKSKKPKMVKEQDEPEVTSEADKKAKDKDDDDEEEDDDKPAKSKPVKESIREETTVGEENKAVTAEMKALREQVTALEGVSRLQYLEGRMLAEQITDPLKEKLREWLTAQPNTPTEQAIESQVKSYAEIARMSQPSQPAFAAPYGASMQTGPVTMDRIMASVDRFFGAEKFFGIDGETEIPLKETIDFRTLPQLYGMLTGDWNVSGVPNYENSLLREHSPSAAGAQWGTLGGAPTGFSGILGTSMNRVSAMEFAGQDRWWTPLVNTRPVSNLKEQEVVRRSGFGAMPERTNDRDTYPVVTIDDVSQTYYPKDYGMIAQLTKPMIINDDLGTFRSIPSDFAKSGVYTINKFVADLYKSKGDLFKAEVGGVAGEIFTAAHGNLSTGVLSRANLTAAIIAMRKQEHYVAAQTAQEVQSTGSSRAVTPGGEERMAIRARFLLVPADLLPTAYELLASAQTPDTANNAVNYLNAYGLSPAIEVPQFTDMNDWYLSASPNEVPTIELGFLNGQETPTIASQMDPGVGLVFTHDVVSWKQTWYFGGNFGDYRGVYASRVA